MTVRTEKIQALTGSAPLTLPTSLPTSKKGVQVSTTGVISTPASADSMTNLTSSVGSIPGWVLLDHIEQENGATKMTVSAQGNTDYPASDIYQYELRYNIMGYYQNSPTYIRMSPMVDGVRKPNGNGQMQWGFSFLYQGGGQPGKGTYSESGNGTGTDDNSYMYQTYQKFNGMSSPTGNTYSTNFDKTKASYTTGRAGDGGIQGRFRYYNGSGYQGSRIDPVGRNTRTNNSSNSYQSIKQGMQFTSYPVSSNPTHTDKVNGFEFYTYNTNRVILGFIQLWGMPKTVS
tara:strand:- start:2338 stop:3198 length:861 start_codon:yes stop_codon:yes gene_type:complete